MSGRSGGMAVDHVQRSMPFCMTVGLGRVALHDQARAVLHQRMTVEAQHRPGAGRLLVKPGVWVSQRSVCGVGPLLVAEIDIGIAALTGYLVSLVLGVSLGLALFGVVLGRHVGSERAARIVVRRRVPTFGWKLFIDAQSLTNVPSTEKCSSDSSSATSQCATIAAIIFLDITEVSNRSRFLPKTVGTHSGSSIAKPTSQRNMKLYCICSISCRSERTENRICFRLARISRSGAMEG